MLRLMLDGHPNIVNPGEVDFLFDEVAENGDHPPLPQYLDWLSTHRIFLAMRLRVDPALSYPEIVTSFVEQLRKPDSILAMNIHRGFAKVPKFFPDARYIHLLRDPRAVSRSTVEKGWAGHPVFGVNHWLESEESWDILKADLRDDQYLEVRYEQLVTMPKEILTQICAFLNLPFSDLMLAYSPRSNYDSPDPELIDQWRRKLTKRQIQLIEWKINNRLEQRGYRLSGYAEIVPGAIERRFVKLQHKGRRFAFKLARYGLAVFILETLSKLFGNPTLAKTVALKKNAIDTRHLK